MITTSPYRTRYLRISPHIDRSWSECQLGTKGTCISQSNASLCARTNTNYYRRRRRNGYNNPICPIGDVGAIIFQHTIIPFPRPSSWPVDRHVPTPERAARYEIGFCDMHRAAIGRIYNLGPSDRLLPVVDDLVMNEFEVKVVMRYHSYRILLLPAIRSCGLPFTILMGAIISTADVTIVLKQQ